MTSGRKQSPSRAAAVPSSMSDDRARVCHRLAAPSTNCSSDDSGTTYTTAVVADRHQHDRDHRLGLDATAMTASSSTSTSVLTCAARTLSVSSGGERQYHHHRPRDSVRPQRHLLSTRRRKGRCRCDDHDDELTSHLSCDTLWSRFRWTTRRNTNTINRSGSSSLLFLLLCCAGLALLSCVSTTVSAAAVTARAHQPSASPPLTAAPLQPQRPVAAASVSASALRSPPQSSSPSRDYYTHATFSTNATLTHLVVDRTSGRVYAGAVNRLYQLDAQLRLQAALTTGPKQDSPTCLSQSSSCEAAERRATDNVNKLLVLDYDNRQLISCGSLYQGACQLYGLPNISASVNHIERAMAANDDTSSTFAFVGPQRYLGNNSKVLYLAVTFTKNGPYRDAVPAISSRRLETLDLAEMGFSKSPIVEIDSKLRDYFRVRYKYGFQWGEHAYFVTVQRKSHQQSSEEEGYVSRVARVCIGDPNYNTYTEITLQCTAPAPPVAGGGQQQQPKLLYFNVAEAVTTVEASADLAEALRVPLGELVLVGVFARSVNHTLDTYPQAALCAYPLSDIEQKFNENIHMCLNGSVHSRGMDYIAGSLGNCPETGTTGNIYNFCEASLRISGTVPAGAHASLVYANTTATAILGTTTEQHTVILMGTKRGTVKKILLTGRGSAVEYEEVAVERNRPILGDMVLDVSGDYVYAMTANKITKLKMENCTKYASCSSCIGARDPYCGWCSLERRCTVKATCQNATRTDVSPSPPRWLSLGSQCIDFQDVRPNMVTITESTMLDLTIHELPSGPKYLCVFGNSQPMEATVTPTGLNCRTPPLAMRPKIPKGLDHVSVPLSVRSSETNTDFVSRDFNFYDCLAHKTCKSCTTSRWGCNWCIYENKCTGNATTCHSMVPSSLKPLTANTSNRVSAGAPRMAICPRFARTDNILLPNEVAKEIEVAVLDLPSPQPMQSGFQCIIEIEGAKAVVDARASGSRVICAERAYTFQSIVGELKANLTVVWNGHYHIDTTEVTLYKCSVLGSHHLRSDCSLCMIQHQKYGCAWCANSCMYRKSCQGPSSEDCPKPRIDVIRPLSAPIEGGTLVTIEGGNLGSRPEEVRSNISIGDIPCELVSYNVSVKIVCRAGPSKNGELSASVKVGNRRNFTISTEKFHYKNVSVYDVFPNIGPTSGGTRLTIRGNNLNVGNEVRVFLDELPCRVDKFVTTNSQISCITFRSPIANRKINHLRVLIDGAIRLLNYPFTYIHDPTITKIYPTETFSSGGRHITVEGTNLEAILNPRMAVFANEKILNESMCQVVNNTVMDCPTPPVNKLAIGESEERKRRDLAKFSVRIGFIMDEVQTVMRLAEHFPHVDNELTYVDDPRFFPFDKNRVKLYKGDTLVIEGENLKLASDERDVNVTIGMLVCNVTSLAMSQLVCTPPGGQPKGTDENGRPTDNKLPLVVVRVGDNLRFPIGYLRYEVIRSYEFPEEAIGGIAAGGAFLIMLSVVILIVYRRKSTQAEREYKRIQIQMDNLESNVRSECKQAFAELQTDMTDLTSDLEATGIPALDHKTYVMKVFFPGVLDHPILQDPMILPEGAAHLPYMNRRQMVIRTNYDAAMVQFEHLLCNKNFLLVFIDALENQKSFSIRDKVSVASLLMVILMGKMEYATDVLKSLLLKLIDKYILTKHPQLMLRRTESVVEKMLTNWMALVMYNYLRDYAGSSLFLLVKAINHQIEKGPVDYVTHDARYSLSEEKLLREQIHHNVVTIQVIQEDLDEKVQCKILDCDTIGQVKSKILDALYKNTPYSMRPSINEVDLGTWAEWRHGRGGHLTLADEDLTTKPIGGYRQLNTLAHYGVKESAVMSLIAKQNDSFTSNCKQPCNNCTGHYSLNSVSPIVNGDVEHGVKVYHLVKPVDDHQYIQNSKERTHKAIPEIFLTRLLSTKGTVQKFVDDFFLTILTANEALPPAVKWLFDTFDEAAKRQGITDPEVVHAWKSNSIPLRFWVNFIKNPDFIFDIYKTPTVDACLSVIAQTFMDSCSTSEHRLGKDSPSNKLLFAKDIPAYKEMVSKFYNDIQQMPQITDQELNSAMQQLSMVQMGEFDTISALKELYIYATKYSDYVLEALESDPYCSRMHLAHKLENVACTFEGEETSTC